MHDLFDQSKYIVCDKLLSSSVFHVFRLNRIQRNYPFQSNQSLADSIDFQFWRQKKKQSNSKLFAECDYEWSCYFSCHLNNKVVVSPKRFVVLSHRYPDSHCVAPCAIISCAIYPFSIHAVNRLQKSMSSLFVVHTRRHRRRYKKR